MMGKPTMRMVIAILALVCILMAPYSLFNIFQPSEQKDPRDALEFDPVPKYDPDGDLLEDIVEASTTLTDPVQVDSDMDGLSDFIENEYWNRVHDRQDTLPQGTLDLLAQTRTGQLTNPRAALLPTADLDGDGLINIRDPDSDGDTIDDGWEVINGQLPYEPVDTTTKEGRDTLRSYHWGGETEFIDQDGDGMDDQWEELAFLNSSDPTDANDDPDGDGLSNLLEFLMAEDVNGAVTGICYDPNYAVLLSDYKVRRYMLNYLYKYLDEDRVDQRGRSTNEAYLDLFTDITDLAELAATYRTLNQTSSAFITRALQLMDEYQSTVRAVDAVRNDDPVFYVYPPEQARYWRMRSYERIDEPLIRGKTNSFEDGEIWEEALYDLSYVDRNDNVFIHEETFFQESIYYPVFGSDSNPNIDTYEYLGVLESNTTCRITMASPTEGLIPTAALTPDHRLTQPRGHVVDSNSYAYPFDDDLMVHHWQYDLRPTTPVRQYELNMVNAHLDLATIESFGLSSRGYSMTEGPITDYLDTIPNYSPAASNFDNLMAIQRHLIKTNFRDFPYPMSSTNMSTLDYSIAAILVLREAGIDCKLTTGFGPGTIENGVRVVRASQARAWVEVGVYQLGYIPFEFSPTEIHPMGMEFPAPTYDGFDPYMVRYDPATDAHLMGEAAALARRIEYGSIYDHLADSDIHDHDLDGIMNSEDADDDNDGLIDIEERDRGSNQFSPDTDGDGLDDKEEVERLLVLTNGDSDGDGVLDGQQPTAPPQNYLTMLPDNSDRDGDGIPNSLEATLFPSIRSPAFEPDVDADGLPDGHERLLGLDYYDADSDSDGLKDGAELSWGRSYPLQTDSDGDGLKDGTEVVFGSMPNTPDTDGDGLSDTEEILRHIETKPITSAYEVDTNRNMVPDSDEFFFSKNKTYNAHIPVPLPKVTYEDQENRTEDTNTSFLGNLSKIKVPSVRRTVIGILAIAGVLLLAAIVFTLIRNKRRDDFKELLDIIDTTTKKLYDTESPEGVRAAIIEAYRRMGLLLETKGYKREDAETVREFEDALQAYLPIKTNSITKLTDLFEEARYSDHELDPKMRDKAIKALERLRKDIEKLSDEDLQVQKKVERAFTKKHEISEDEVERRLKEVSDRYFLEASAEYAQDKIISDFHDDMKRYQKMVGAVVDEEDSVDYSYTKVVNIEGPEPMGEDTLRILNEDPVVATEEGMPKIWRPPELGGEEE